LIAELAHLSSQASNFRSPSWNLHGKLGSHRLSLELSLSFNDALLLKECHLLGIC
jgi:hypothetical protein